MTSNADHGPWFDEVPPYFTTISSRKKVILFLIDVAVHTSIVFGWSSITEILKDENFFRNQSDESKSSQSELDTLSELVPSRSSDQNETLETCFVDDEEEGAQSQEIALIFTLTTSLLGIFILIFGFIRDYICSGIARFTMLLFLRKRLHLIFKINTDLIHIILIHIWTTCFDHIIWTTCYDHIIWTIYHGN